MPDTPARAFLFLQGPHGPFFASLGRMLRHTGAQVWRVGFTAADRVFWPDAAHYLPFRGPLEAWDGTCAQILEAHGITDLVLYGDIRPVHARAIALAQARGITVHVFEEGYLRPWWVSYERGGSNGHSRLMEMDVDRMRALQAESPHELPMPPAHWGETRHHVVYGALYHFFVLLWNRPYRALGPHRDLSVRDEFALYVRRLITMPLRAVQRMWATRRIRRGGFPYHLALLQLDHDASFRAHSPFRTMPEFVEAVIDGFARGAPGHHHLVFKDHPLEDGRAPISHTIRRAAKAAGIEARVHYVRGGKLAHLLDACRSAVTVNSTAAQQALWRGLPLKAFGRAVYDKPEFVSQQGLADFFADPQRPDVAAYRAYRDFLLETSQLPGGFYSARGRRQVLRQVVDLMLAPMDPYDALTRPSAAGRQQLRIVT